MWGTRDLLRGQRRGELCAFLLVSMLEEQHQIGDWFASCLLRKMREKPLLIFCPCFVLWHQFLIFIVFTVFDGRPVGSRSTSGARCGQRGRRVSPDESYNMGLTGFSENSRNGKFLDGR
jgi:hypothetical protein